MASMAQFDSVRPSSVDSDRPMSRLSSRSASSISLASSTTLSDSDYHSCVNEMSTEGFLSDEFSFNGVDLEELEILLEAEADDQPLTVLVYSIASSPVPSPLLMPPLSIIHSTTIEQPIQSD